MELWGSVRYEAKDRSEFSPDSSTPDLVPLCATAHDNVHAYMEFLNGRRKERPRINSYLIGLAYVGHFRTLAAMLEKARS